MNNSVEVRPLKIGVSYWGQPRIIQHTFENFTNTILDNKNEFHILYSTWNTENIDEFKTFFSNAYIKQYERPNLGEIDIYKNILDKYRIDPTNSNNKKNLEHYLLGLYIKKSSGNTIIEYENRKNIKFDIVISLRTDTRIYNGDMRIFYNIVFDINSDKKIFVANEPKFDIYSNGSSPDVIMFGKSENIKKALCHLDIIDKTAVTDANFIHPETSFHKSISALGLIINNLNFCAFPKQT
jgi:hypothetical protein